MDTIARIGVIGLLAALLLPVTLPAEQQPDPELREILRKAAGEVDTFPDRFAAGSGSPTCRGASRDRSGTPRNASRS